jgi:hypothetical protein
MAFRVLIAGFSLGLAALVSGLLPVLLPAPAWAAPIQIFYDDFGC